MMSEALRKQGNEVSLILARNLSEKKDKQKGIVYVPTLNVKILSGFLFGFIVFLYLPRLIKNKKVDIIIISGDTIWSPFLLLLKAFKIPLILDMRSLPIDTDTIKLKNISLYLSRYLTDGLTTITPELAEILKKKFHLQDKKIGIWSSGFSKTQFSETQENILKNHLNDKFVLLHHGSYAPSRGIEELIRSIPLVDTLLKNKIKLILVGIPQNKIEEIGLLCKTLDISDQVEIIPPVDIGKIPAYIRYCDVGIIPLPPDNEWWYVSVPLKTLEYLAMGKPIIATSIPFHQKIFDLCNCGILLHSNTPNEIAEAINVLYQKKEKLYDMGKKGKEIVEKYYSWESKATELEEYLKQFL
jgi:glycosyltransferase involved in cell wall biosynthesis